MNRKSLVLPALAGVVASMLVACESGSSQGSGVGDTITVGTTDSFASTEQTPSPFDPAAAYDIGSWNILRNTFQSLLRLPRSGTEPVTEAANRCSFTDQANEQYRCTLRSGLKFSNGNDLTVEDVKFSIERSLKISYENGPKSLLNNIDRVETSASEVVFHLKKPDATFPYKLATPAAAIVDQESYPKDDLIGDFRIVGSGPYLLESFDAADGRAVFTRNANYDGGLEINNSKIVMRFFENPEDMEQALQDGAVDVMTRTITPEQVERLQANTEDSVNLVETPGQGIRYLVFTTDTPPVENRAVRQAVAQVVDRQALVRDVYGRTTEPLYSIVPTGLPGHRNSFFNLYGDPDVQAAGTTLRDAGIETPVELTFTYTTDHYGAVTADEFKELQQQLNGSGLFEVTLEGVPWDEFRPAASEGKYTVYGMGWFPDYPDPDNFIAPFFGPDNILNTPYRNPEIQDEVIPDTRRTAQRSATLESFVRAQELVARDVPLIPLWQGKQFVAAREDITGTEWVLNSSSVLQLWELGRGRND